MGWGFLGHYHKVIREEDRRRQAEVDRRRQAEKKRREIMEENERRTQEMMECMTMMKKQNEANITVYY